MEPEAAPSTHHFIQMQTSLEVPRVSLAWRNVHMSVDVRNPQTKTSETKTILNGVSGCAEPGQLLVIMGPSGAGKTTLLDCLAGRNRAIEGSITVNGRPWDDATKRLANYVLQDDVFYETITVREHLVFQARLRMGNSITREQYLQRVDEVLEQLGLVKCRDTLIGGVRLRGISGGERKRLSFASEILTNPSILFVDEPISGLDSFMAETIVRLLQQIAREGRTVIATVHQPSSELFALFDKLYLLCDGETVYDGEASKAVEYFASLGYRCPAFLNPTDYFMRQLVVVDKEADITGAERIEQFKQEWRNRPSTSSALEAPVAAEISIEANKEDSRLHALGQIRVLARRNVVRLVRDHIAFRVAIMQSLVLALLAGLIYLQLDLTQSGIQNFAGGFFFLVVFTTFSAANPTFIQVPMELPIVIREYRASLYYLSSWYLAKNVSELPMQILQPIVFFVPVHLLMGIGHGFDVYLGMQAILMLVNSTAIGMGYMVSCIARRVDLAPVIGVVLFLPFLLLGGLLINSDDAPVYFVWIQYISPIKYGYEALMKLYWHQVASIPCNTSVENCVALTGSQVLQNFSMQDRSPFGDGLIMIAINVGFRTIGFLALWIHLREKEQT